VVNLDWVEWWFNDEGWWIPWFNLFRICCKYKKGINKKLTRDYFIEKIIGFKVFLIDIIT
jgi:hypothetical protein